MRRRRSRSPSTGRRSPRRATTQQLVDDAAAAAPAVAQQRSTGSAVKDAGAVAKQGQQRAVSTAEPPHHHASALARAVHDWLGLRDEPADKDGLWGGLNLPRAQYMYIWRLSWLSLLSGLLALYYGHRDLALVPLGVWLTSINFWRRPDFSWRRTVDIVYVQIALWWQVYRAWGAQRMGLYYAIKGVGMLCFPLGLFFRHQYNAVWASTLAHGMVHILGNVGNVVLYSGHVPPGPLHAWEGQGQWWQGQWWQGEGQSGSELWAALAGAAGAMAAEEAAGAMAGSAIVSLT